MNTHTARLWFRYSCKYCGCTKTDIKVFSGIAVLFALTVVWWIHSPLYAFEKDSQRQQAIAFLLQHQWEMSAENVQEVMQVYKITWDEIKSPLELIK